MSGPFSPLTFLASHHGFHLSTKTSKNLMMNKCIHCETPKVKSKINLIREEASQTLKHGGRSIRGTNHTKGRAWPCGIRENELQLSVKRLRRSGGTCFSDSIFINTLSELISSMGESISIKMDA